MRCGRFRSWPLQRIKLTKIQLWIMLFEMQSVIWQQTPMLTFLFVLRQFICHDLTMAIELRGDERTIRLNLEEYTGVNWMILRDDGMMPMLGVRHVHRMDDSCRGHLNSYCQQIVQLMLLPLSAYPLAIRYCIVVRTRGTCLIYEINGEHLSCPLAGGHNKNNIRTSIWKPNPTAHLIGTDHSMKLWPLIRTLSTQSRARVGMFAATPCYYWAEQS